MFYQPLLWKEKSYNVGIGGVERFPLHLHHEIEMLYCINGELKISNNGRRYTVDEGEVIIIGSMSAHEIEIMEKSTYLLVELGPVFLGKNFKKLKECTFYREPYSLNTNELYAIVLKKLFEEICTECRNPSDVSELIIQGNVYKICACLMKDVPKDEKADNARLKNAETMEKVLEMVYYHYNEPISVEDAAKLCGYGKSNFCKVFKNTVGESFHTYLNSFRIKNSEYLLRETKMSIEEVAIAAGFADAKSYCRVFKTNTGMTPGQYRREG